MGYLLEVSERVMAQIKDLQFGFFKGRSDVFKEVGHCLYANKAEDAQRFNVCAAE